MLASILRPLHQVMKAASPDEAASVWKPVKACHDFNNDFTLFTAVPVLFIMYTNKDSNLLSTLSRSLLFQLSFLFFIKYSLLINILLGSFLVLRSWMSFHVMLGSTHFPMLLLLNILGNWCHIYNLLCALRYTTASLWVPFLCNSQAEY